VDGKGRPEIPQIWLQISGDRLPALNVWQTRQKKKSTSLRMLMYRAKVTAAQPMLTGFNMGELTSLPAGDASRQLIVAPF
jgi:hypothetical protein